MPISKTKAEDIRRWSANVVHLTPEGLKRLERKLARLKAAVPDLVAEAARTAAYGDRSENAEYKDAKGRLRRTYGQIRSIEDQLKRVKLIPSGPSESGAVQIGSTVTIELESGAIKKYEVLGPEESDPAKGRISYQSPLGAALLGRVVGDVVAVKMGAELREYRILEVR